MGIANNWTLRVKRKDNKELTSEQIEKILNLDIYEEDNPSELPIINYKYPEYELPFYTDCYGAADYIEEELLKLSKEEPILSIQLECVCTEYGGDDFIRTNYSNGKSEDMIGYIEYPAPEEVFY